MTTSSHALQTPFQVSRYLEEVAANEPGKTLLFSTRTGRLVSLGTPAWEGIKEGRIDTLAATTRDQLAKAGVLVPSGTDEYASGVARSKLAAGSDRVISRYVMPTAFCQLNCGYCGQQHDRTILNEDAIARLLAGLEESFASGRFDEFLVTWFGGEPTAASQVIEHISERLKVLCAKYGVRLTGRVITNGVALAQPLAERLHADCGVSSFVISIDGPEQIHNQRRPRLDGKGSRHAILTNVLSIASSDVLTRCEIHIRVNIDRDNAQYVHEFIEELAQLGLAGRVKVEFAVVVEWGPVLAQSLIERSEFANREVAWLAHLMSRGFQVAWLPSPKAVPCLAVEPASHVVSPDGSAHNCAMTPLSPRSETRLTRRFRDSSSAAVETEGTERMQEYFQLLGSGAVPCRQCNVLFLCQGGCPKEIDSGALPCPTFKFNLPSRIRLWEMDRILTEAASRPVTVAWSWPDTPEVDRSLVERTVNRHSEAFRKRFRFYPLPEVVRVVPSDAPDERAPPANTHCHRLLHSYSNDEGLAKEILIECAERFLKHLNPSLYHEYEHSRSPAAQLGAQFIAWAVRRFLPDEAEDDRAVDRLARAGCIDQIMTLPVPKLSELWAAN